MCIGLYVNYSYSYQICEKKPNCQFSYKCFLAEPINSMRTDRQAGMTKLIIAFRNFLNALKNTL